MKKTILVAAILTTVLSGCACLREGGTGGPGVPWIGVNPNNPRIAVVDKAILIVDQEPIYITQRDSNTIVWEIDPSSGFYFPSDEKSHPGIEFFATGDNPKLLANCRRGETRSKFICNYERTKRSRTKYFYKITATTDDVGFIQSDPSMMND